MSNVCSIYKIPVILLYLYLNLYSYFLDRLFEESFLEFETINELICFISRKHNNIFCILDILFF